MKLIKLWAKKISSVNANSFLQNKNSAKFFDVFSLVFLTVTIVRFVYIWQNFGDHRHLDKWSGSKLTENSPKSTWILYNSGYEPFLLRVLI